MTDDLLNSISKFDNQSLDNIIISDDGSDADTITLLSFLKDKYENIFKIIPIYNPHYHSFAKTVNSGMKISNTNNDILLLNNDMLALTSFEPFVEFIKGKTMNQNNKVGVVGCKLLYPNNTIQHAGMVRMRLIKRFRHIYKFRNSNYPPANIRKKYIAVTGACQYINRDLLNKIESFDERYILSYEDVDFCISGLSNGYEVWYIPDVEMIHYESATRTDPYGRQNRYLFWKKWGNLYESIRKNQDIPDDDLDIKVVETSGLVGISYLILK